MVEPSGQAKLLDFGVTKIRNCGDFKTLTVTGTLIGTPPYIAPERSRDAEFDGRSDAFATGVMLYELLIGELPFQARTTRTIRQ
jgi:serine/threonine-protein kinase